MQSRAKWIERVVQLLDLTSLRNTESRADIVALCGSVNSGFGYPAALCLYSNYVSQAREILVQQQALLPVAAVVNYPGGGANIAMAMDQIQIALKRGAEEIEFVLPYSELKRGNVALCQSMLSSARALCPAPIRLKIIIETTELKSDALIQLACQLALDAGCDFISTSTLGKDCQTNLNDVDLILRVIKQAEKPVGLKVSGGVNAIESAIACIELADDIMGTGWVCQSTFRIGSEQLFTALVNEYAALGVVHN